jgi:thiol-disulfide isomerase/thioredoxin
MINWDNIKDKFSDIISNQRFFLMLFIALIFIIAAVYVYNNNVKPRIDADYVANKEFLKKGSGEEGGQTLDLIYFYTTWCPHCKNSKPEWNKFRDKMENKEINGYTINFLEVDCEKDEKEANKYNIEGYPTIKLLKGSSVIEYDAKPDSKTLSQFIDQFTK